MNSRKVLLYWFIGQPFTIACQFFLMIYTARVLGPDQKGLFAAAFATVSIFQMLQNFGLGSFVIREPNLDKNDLSTAYSTLWVGCIFVSVATVLFAQPLARFANDPRLVELFYVLALSPLVMPIQMIALGLALRNHQHKIQVYLALSRSITTVVVVYWMCESGFGAVSMAWSYVLASFAVTVVSVIAQPSVLKIRLGFESRQKVWKFATGMLGVSYLIGLQPRLYELMITRTLGVTSTGYYSQMQALSDPIKANLQQVVLAAMFPGLAEEVRGGRNPNRLFLKLLECLSGFMAPIYGSIAILSPNIVEYLFGPSWVSAAPLLTYICIIQLILLFSAGASELMVILDKVKELALIEGINLVVSVSAFFYFLRFGLAAAVVSLIFCAVLSSLLYIYFVWRFTPIKARELVFIYARSVFLASVAIIPALFLFFYYPALKLTIFYVAAIAVTAALFAFIGAGVVKHQLYREILSSFVLVFERFRRRGQ